jgi:hypothetical protein
MNQLERRTNPLLLLVVAVVVVLRLRAYRKSISTLGTDHASPTLCLHCFVESGMHWGKKKETYLSCGLPMQVVNVLVILVLPSFNPPHSHVSPIPSHISCLISFSLGDDIDSCSDLASTAKTENQHETREKVERTPLSNQVKRRSWECPYPRTWLYV